MPQSDWGELQQRFLSKHATTGVSPKEWCETQGLNYATARRYIKKPSAQSAQKSAQKKMRAAQEDKSANELMDDDGLTAQQRLFVAEYLKDNNATAAAARAGYSDPNYGRQLIANPNVAQAIAQQQKASILRTLGSADEVLAQMWQLATFDANELSQYRRGACRYCHGFGHNYQWRDMVEFEEHRLKAIEKKGKDPVDVGGYGYDHNREPNPACPRCNGDGIGQPYFADTRKLPPVSRLAYSGIKLGKNGVEITAISRERMYEAVMKRLGLADSEFAQQLQQIEIERRQLEVEKLRKELAADPEDEVPMPVAININVADARVRKDDDGDNEFSEVIGVDVADATLEGYVKYGLKALTAAIGANTDMVVTADIETDGKKTLTRGLRKYGDKFNRVVLFVMHSATYFDIVDEAIASKIYEEAGVVVYGGQPGTLGKPVLVTDTMDAAAILGLVAGAVTVTESQAPGFRSYDINDQENLAVGYRAEGTVNVELLGYSWDTAKGENPDLTAIGTAANWKKHFTSNKSTAGVLIKLGAASGE
jgi:hypothetical protein